MALHKTHRKDFEETGSCQIYWFIVYDSDPTLIKHWGDVSRLLRHPIYFFYILAYTLYYVLN